MMRKRFRLLGVLALVLALVMPSSAFAWDLVGDGTWWRGNTSQGMYGACVHAGNKYDAAAWLFSRGDPAMLSSEVRTKLSDPNYGGRFYEYAQTFSHMEDLTQYPEWLPAYVGVANLFANGFVLGITNVGFYTSNVSESLYSGAKIDFERVLAGEDLSGGGSSGGDDTTTISSSITLNTAHGSYCNSYSWGQNYIDANGSFTVNFSDLNGFKNTMSSHGCSYLYLVAAPRDQRKNGVAGSGGDLYVFISTSPVSFSFEQVTDSSIHSLIVSLSCPDGTIYSKAYSKKCSSVFPSSSVTNTINPGSATVPASPSFSNCGNSYVIPYSLDHDYHVTQVFTNGIGGTPPPPSGVWPVAPSVSGVPAPEIPTPTAPVATTEPSVSGPSVVWPEITINVEPTPEGLDYTELLRAINNNLNSLRSDLNQEFDSVISSLRNIYQYLQHLDSMLERHCKHIRDSIEDNVYELELWLKSLFEWLPKQLDYDADLNFDDSQIKYLLRRILNKIPGGSTAAPTTYKPNPQADEPGFFDWLLDLWHRFLIDLVSVLPDELGGLVDAFSQLTHYFPFSIPWDLFALLLLFEHEPVTPVFQIPWGYGGGDGQTQMITIDLSVWDGVMAMVRPVFLVGFCFKLALITKDLLAGFDLNKGGV